MGVYSTIMNEILTYATKLFTAQNVLNLWVGPGKSYWRGRLSAVDIHVRTS